jgi:polyhydroxyalkanoate synthesis regulator phasin
MAERGEMSTEEARKFVDDLMEQAQQGTVPSQNNSSTREPRRIEIVDEVSTPQPTETAKSPRSNLNKDDLHQQVQFLQEELRRLKKDM